MIKAYSRRVPSVCLSSAEAELYGIIEVTHESMGVAILIETLLYGLPPRNHLGEFVRVEGRLNLREILKPPSTSAACQVCFVN